MAYSVGIIQNASYLTPGQKRDILYKNAARFLRLDSKSPKGSDGIRWRLQLTLAEGLGWTPNRLPPTANLDHYLSDVRAISGAARSCNDGLRWPLEVN